MLRLGGGVLQGIYNVNLDLLFLFFLFYDCHKIMAQ